MKRRNVNRFFLYVMVLICIVGNVGVFFAGLEKISALFYICNILAVIAGLFMLYLLRQDGYYAKQRVKKEKEKNRLLLSVVPELFTQEYPEEHNIRIDGDAAADYGMEKGDIEKSSFLERILPEDMEKYNKAYRQILAGAETAMANIRWRDSKNKYFWCEYHMVSVKNEENKIVRIMGVMVNTDRKLKAEAANQQIYKCVRKAYSRVFLLDVETDFYRYLQRDELAYYNYEKSGNFMELNLKYMEEYVLEEDRHKLKEFLGKNYLREHLSVENPNILLRYRKNVPEEAWETVEIVLISLEEGKAAQVLVLVRDEKESEKIS